MNNGHKTRWVAFLWRGNGQANGSPPPSAPSESLFDPHSLARKAKPATKRASIFVWTGFAVVAVVPALILWWFTNAAANVYYQPHYAGLLSAIVAGVFCLEASHQLYKLLYRPSSNDTPLPIRLARLVLATALFFVVLLVTAQFALRMENYWLYFAFGDYAPYAFHHIVLLFLLFECWQWYEKVAKGAVRPKDRQFDSGRSFTGDEEAQRRRDRLFK